MTGANERASARGLEVLVVEDEGSVGRVMSGVLAREGHRVLVAASAEEAIDYAQGIDFDVIFTDIALPGMTGLQAIGEFKKRSEAPVIIMTGYADEDIQKDALLLGAAGFLEKPLDFDQLRGVLRALALRPAAGGAIR